MSELEATAPAEADTGTSPVKNNVRDFESAKIRRTKQRIELQKLLQDIDLIETLDLDSSAIEIIESERLLDRAAKLPTAYDSAIAEAIVKKFGSHPSEIANLKATIKELRSAGRSLTNPKPDKIRTARRQDFYELFETVLGPLRRDIFSDILLYKESESHFWVPAINYMGVVKSEASVMEEEGVCKFPRALFDDHFEAYQRSKTPELISEIPTWDGSDRLEQICKSVVLDNSQSGFNERTVEEIVKAWLAGVFRRMDDPRFQNPALILIGPRKIGKDYLTDTLTDGIGQWAKHLEITGNHKDDYMQLSRGLILRISEFDKLAQTNQAKLKDLIWRPMTSLRKAFAKEEQDRIVRCSFIASTNNHDIYKDSAGHRQYWPLNLAHIVHGYPDSEADRKQIIAQAKALAAAKYEPSARTNEVMADFLETQRPTSIEEDLAEHYEQKVSAFIESGSQVHIAQAIRERGWITLTEARESGIFAELMMYHKISERYLCSKLSVAGLKRRSKKERGYGLARSEAVTGDTSQHTSVTLSVTDIPELF